MGRTTFAEAGRAPAALHLGFLRESDDFESAPEYPLRETETPDVPLDWRVEAIRWADKERTAS